MDEVETVRAYYRTIDAGAYDELRSLLAPGLVHVRPDRTIEGRDAFVRFMREGRPLTDTEHAVDGLYRGSAGIAARGRLLREDSTLFAFVDTFELEEGRIARIVTYTGDTVG